MQPRVFIYSEIRSIQQKKGYGGFNVGKSIAYQYLDSLINFMFPSSEADRISQDEWEELMHTGDQLFAAALKTDYTSEHSKFIAQMPAVLATLYRDAENIMTFDPAATSLEEVILTYPGFYAITVYRICHEMYKLGVPVLPRLLSEYAHGKTGIDIHPGARISPPFFIDHGTGVVIGETCEIGPNVKIYQGVTLGALQVKRELFATKRHPTIEENVIIYAGSTILGGGTVIGHDTVIGGNSWLTESVPPYSLVYHKSEIKVRTKESPEVINFVI